MRARYLYPAILTNFKTPVMMTEGNMQYVYDETGKRYLDCLAGVATVQIGHSHPKLMAAMQEQMPKLIHASSLFYLPDTVEFARDLNEMLPPAFDGDEWVFYFTNSGAEATDKAMLLARAYTGQSEIIALRSGYHGLSEGSRSLTSLRQWRYPGVPPSLNVQHARHPNLYRGLWQTEDSGPKYAEDVQDIIHSQTGGGRCAAFIAEAIGGVNGICPLPKNYLNPVYESVRAAGGVCVADEVQVGYGRSGHYFWGFQTVTDNTVVPDIVTMAKGIGNGFPLGAVAVRRKIADALKGTLTFNTYGGNPLQMVAAKATLKILKEEGMQQNALERGNELKAGLKELQKKHPTLGDVRGEGLMIGIELVKDRTTKEPLGTPEMVEIMTRMKDYGILTGRGGLHLNVIRYLPPLCLTKEDIKFALEATDLALEGF
eukprot:TRINITY_DN93526_c0_g1_i1.p1 TRINITY_DN93526_c0_g1~~TRINITY_DN93526_c0_g1_i1.p1  ORF type:complete len:484 (+),score=70.82 TRINITY_DN93526_c0_g1_i1:168-1454(+)